MVPGLESLGLVSSDCRPWTGVRRLAWCPACGLLQKVVDEDFHADCCRIYESYVVYHQAGGREQCVFGTDGAACARSERLLRRLLERRPLPSSGRLLDVGCGNGVLLRSFGALLPGWRLNGLDLDGRSRETVLALPGAEAFFSCDLSEVPGRFDMLSMMHCLEHVPAPAEFLRKARAALTGDGLLLVQCPDFTANPFDLAIADHCSHFTVASLGALAEDAGFDILVLASGVVPKELTLLARVSSAPREDRPRTAPADSTPDARRALDWLEAALRRARRVAEAAGPNFGVFGTSIGGAWLLGQMPERIRFFVDEDANRVGRPLFGRPVLRPDQAPADASVYICLPAPVARGIATRLAGRCGRLELPPDFPLNNTEQP
jgi:SAM-dependent methyltransferase